MSGFGYSKDSHARMASVQFRHAGRLLAVAKKEAKRGDCDTARAHLHAALVAMGAARAHGEAKSAILRGDDYVFVRRELNPLLEKNSRLWRAVGRVGGLVSRCEREG